MGGLRFFLSPKRKASCFQMLHSACLNMADFVAAAAGGQAGSPDLPHSEC